MALHPRFLSLLDYYSQYNLSLFLLIWLCINNWSITIKSLIDFLFLTFFYSWNSITIIKFWAFFISMIFYFFDMSIFIWYWFDYSYSSMKFELHSLNLHFSKYFYRSTPSYFPWKTRDKKLSFIQKIIGEWIFKNSNCYYDFHWIAFFLIIQITKKTFYNFN